MHFPCKFFKTTDHNLTVNDQHVEFVNSIKYLGVTISSVLSDELDIKARVRSIYCIANMLRARFFKCSVNVKKHFVSLFLFLYLRHQSLVSLSCVQYKSSSCSLQQCLSYTF